MSQKGQKLEWGGIPEVPPPKNPYRDTLLVYGGLSLVIVIVAWVTGGSVGKALAVAVLFFAVASSWTMYRFRARSREAARREGKP
jgi:Flp pilus assembly protein TadB